MAAPEPHIAVRFYSTRNHLIWQCFYSTLTATSFAGISKESLKEFEKSEAYKKYVLPTLEREKQLKRQKRSEWFWIKGLLILNTIFAGTSAICAVISLLK